MMISRLLLICRDRGGASAVEFAFAMPILIMLLIGVFEFGRLFWTWTTIQYAAEQTGRYAMSKPTATPADLTAYLRNRLPGVSSAAVDIDVSPETVDGVNYMVIVTRFNFSFLNLFPVSSVDLEGRSRVPMVI
jgi:Flp pilus assembly protein TadG